MQLKIVQSLNLKFLLTARQYKMYLFVSFFSLSIPLNSIGYYNRWKIYHRKRNINKFHIGRSNRTVSWSSRSFVSFLCGFIAIITILEFSYRGIESLVRVKKLLFYCIHIIQKPMVEIETSFCIMLSEARRGGKNRCEE